MHVENFRKSRFRHICSKHDALTVVSKLVLRQSMVDISMKYAFMLCDLIVCLLFGFYWYAFVNFLFFYLRDYLYCTYDIWCVYMHV